MKRASVALIQLALLLGVAGMLEAQVRMQSVALSGGGGHTSTGGVRVGMTLGQTLGGVYNDESNASGVGFWYTTLDEITIVSAETGQIGDEIPEQYELHQNYPNPFNPTTRIRYGLPEAAVVNISIYNVLGQLVSSLVNKEQQAGYYEIDWDARTNTGVALPSGLYFFRINTKHFVQTRSMVFHK